MRLIFLSILSCVATSSDGTRCFECMDVQFPRDCVKLTVCNSDEVCFTEQVVHSSGNITFNSGCLHKSRCSTISTPLIGKRSANITMANIRSTDITTCRECCVGDVCNSKGCGANEIPVERRGPYCYTCDVLDPKACNNVAVCGKNEVCMIYSPVEFSALPDTLYRGQCETHTACNALSQKFQSQCDPTCCSTDFCNDHCGTPPNVTMTTSFPHTTEGKKDTTTSKQNSHIVTTPPTTPSSTANGNRSFCNFTDFTLLESDHAQLCVHIITQQLKSWDDARAACKKQGGDLVVLTTRYKRHLLTTYLETNSRYHHKFFWIGLKDFNNNDHFSWISHPALYITTGWAKGQPDHYSNGKKQDCVCMHSDTYPQYKWNDQNCNDLGYFICERK